MLEKLTNDTKIELNETGTSIYYNPGLLNGGELEHDCSLQRGIGYYLEGIMMLAPFCKKPIEAKLKGVTNNSIGTTYNMLTIYICIYLYYSRYLIYLNLR